MDKVFADLGAKPITNEPVRSTPDPFKALGAKRIPLSTVDRVAEAAVLKLRKDHPVLYAVGNAVNEADPFGFRQFAIRHLGKYITPEHPEALDAISQAMKRVQRQTSLKDIQKYPGIAGEIGGAIAEFGALGGVGKAGGAVGAAKKFAAARLLQLPTAQEEQQPLGETLKQRGIGALEAAGTGAALGVVGKVIKNPLWRIPTVTGGVMALTGLEGGSREQILESGINVLGFEAVGLAQKGLYKRAVQKAIKKNPKLAQADPAALEASAAQIGKLAFDKKVDKKLSAWAKTAKRFRTEEIETRVKALRKRQAAKGTAIGQQEAANVGEAIRKSKAGYADTAGIPDMEPPKLSEKEWRSLENRIAKVYPLDDPSVQFQRTDTLDALDGLRTGRVPTPREFGLLDKILGRKTVIDIFTNTRKKRKFSGWDLPGEAIQLSKSIFGLDFQTFRQGRSLAARHPKVYLKGGYENVKGYFSEQAAIKQQARLEESPGWELSTKYVNYVGEAGYKTNRLEYYSLGLTERLLQSKNRIFRLYGKWLQAAERGAVVGINTMEKGLWDISEKRLAKVMKYRKLTPEQIEQWRTNHGKNINTFMKILRAKGRSAKEIQRVANYFLFSPSMTAARPLQLKALVANKMARGDAAEIITSNIASIFIPSAIIATIAATHRQQNPDQEPPLDSDTNPTSSGWGKVRVGQNVFDLTGGDAPFYRTLMRMGVSTYLAAKEQVTGKKQTKWYGQKIIPATETFKRYLETRETALLTLGKTLLTGKDWLGNDIPRWEALVRAVGPELITSVVDAGLANGLWATIANGDISTASKQAVSPTATGLAALFSVGTSSYPIPSAVTRNKFEDIIAQDKYEKDWDRLSPQQRRSLQRKYKKQFTDFERRVKSESTESTNYEYVAKKIENERKAGTNALKEVSQAVKKELSYQGITLLLPRTIQKYRLSDELYQEYQKAVGKQLQKRLDRMVSSVTWDRRSDRTKKYQLQQAIAIAKRIAQSEILRKARRQ